MIELFKWREGDFNLVETAYSAFSLLFGDYRGIQVSSGRGFIKISLGTGKHCYELSLVNYKKRPDWDEFDIDDERLIFKIGGKK